MPYTYQHPRPSVTVDIVVFKTDVHMRPSEVLLIRRGKEPHRGRLALPGGFMEIGEDPVDSAVRELREETGVVVNRDLELVCVLGAPLRDPRGRVVSIVYVAVVNDDVVAAAGDDAADAQWIGVHDAMDMRLAFDHNDAVEAAYYIVHERAVA